MHRGKARCSVAGASRFSSLQGPVAVSGSCQLIDLTKGCSDTVQPPLHQSILFLYAYASHVRIMFRIMHAAQMTAGGTRCCWLQNDCHNEIALEALHSVSCNVSCMVCSCSSQDWNMCSAYSTAGTNSRVHAHADQHDSNTRCNSKPVDQPGVDDAGAVLHH